jgi:Na+/proline symporter
LGLLWRRANGVAAVATIISGFSFLFLLQEGIPVPSGLQTYFGEELMPPLWDAIPWLTPFKRAYQHSALLTWVFCMIVMIATSLLTAPPPREQVESIIWNRSFLKLPPELRNRYRGWENYVLWWALFVIAVLSIYGYFLWFDLSRPN